MPPLNRHSIVLLREFTMYLPKIGRCLSALAILLSAGDAAVCVAADEFERPPIEYSSSTPDNLVSRLQASLQRGERTLEYGEKQGYLPALLQALEVPISSQMLVFSKTSLQLRCIAPRTPRAIYFNDDVYIGFCRSGDVLEVSAVDPQLGAVFYTVDQKKPDGARITRHTENCLVCHSSSRSEGVPGHVVRSLFAGTSGDPILSAGSYTVDHTTPLEHRWGGWYVTGTHGDQRHLGNLVVAGDDVDPPVENTAGQNVTALDERLTVGAYLSPHSDIVALMVLEHQTLVHNRLTKANFEARSSLYYQTEMNRAFGESQATRSESVTRRIQSAGDDLVDALLLVDEAKLSAEIRGTSGFAEEFSQRGPRDAKGRSLRDLDLKTRLFRYPCSYLIYSRSFDALPDEMRNYVWQRLWDVLSGKSVDAKFRHLSADDRAAIIEILRETKSGLPESWKRNAASGVAGGE
jgi:hypothetical protein